MYGVVGYLDRAGDGYAPIGRIALKMLRSLSPHTPDSTGACIFRAGDHAAKCWSR